jgi:hypothetical protein
MHNLNLKDIAAGLFFIAVGAAFIIDAMLTLDLGTAMQMGPGYFPVLLAGALCLLGLVIALQGVWAGPSSFGNVSWRGIVLVGLSPITFGASVQPLGLVPALALSTLLASLSSRRLGLRLALAITLGLTVFCIAVFAFALGMPVALFGPLITDGVR